MSVEHFLCNFVQKDLHILHLFFKYPKKSNSTLSDLLCLQDHLIREILSFCQVFYKVRINFCNYFTGLERQSFSAQI